MSVIIPDDYYTHLAKVESDNNPLAQPFDKNGKLLSSASGLYQFTRDTGKALGLAWGTTKGALFGGANNSIDAQQSAIEKLTKQNANYLSNKGVSITPNSLYAAHFLGAGTAAKVFNADPNAKLQNVVGDNVLASNPWLNGMKVSDFNKWLDKKMGGVGTTIAAIPQAIGATMANPLASLIPNLTVIETPDISSAILTDIPTVTFGDGAEFVKNAPGAIADAAGAVADAATSGVSEAIGGFTDQIKSLGKFLGDLFSVRVWGRVAIVVIGISLLIAAVVALVGSSNNKVLIETLAAAA